MGIMEINNIILRKISLLLISVFFLVSFHSSLQAQGEVLQYGESAGEMSIVIFSTPSDQTAFSKGIGYTWKRSIGMGISHTHFSGRSSPNSFITPSLSGYFGNKVVINGNISFPIIDDKVTSVYGVSLFSPFKQEGKTFSPFAGVAFGENTSYQLGMAIKLGDKNGWLLSFGADFGESTSLLFGGGYLFGYRT